MERLALNVKYSIGAFWMIRRWEDVYATRETLVDIIDSAKTDDAMTSYSSIPPTTNHHPPPAAGKKTP